MSETCAWEKAWVGECGEPAVQDDPPRCEDHTGGLWDECVVCGKQATHGCAATMGLVCGAALCDDHDLNDCPRH